ncbi:hypothetical protein DESC_780415 [Desulfosarcina cetonica]|nr:hypothetical protein DESC_780415 [Desulfosarcina cetonica]
MRQEQSGDIIVHERHGFGELKTGHAPGDLHHVPADAVGQAAHLGAQKGAVADENDLLGIDFGQKADGHGLLQIHIAAEAAGQDNPVEILHAHAHLGQQGHATAEDGALGADQVFDIDFGQGDVPVDLGLRGPGEHVFPYAVVLTQALGGQITVEFAQVVDQPQFEHHGGHDDQPRSADALGPHAADGHEHRFPGNRIQGEVLDGALGRPHAELDAAAFEGRPGAAGRTGQPILVTDDDFGVGTDIHEKGQAFVQIQSRPHDPGDDIAAHVAGNGRVDQGGDVVVQCQADVHRPDGWIERGGRYVGRATDVTGIDLEQELGHGGVAGQGDGGDILGIDLGLADDFFDDGVDGLGHDLLQPFQAALFLGIHDPADHVLAVTDLGVEVAVLGQHGTALQVDQLAVDRGRANIHGDGIVALAGVAGLDIDDLGLAAFEHRAGQRGRDPETVLAQHVGQLANHGQADRQAVFVVVQFQMADQTGHIGQMVLVVRFGQLDVDLLHRWQEKTGLLQVVQVFLLDPRRAPRNVALTQDAAVDGRFHRYADGYITGHH